MVLHAEFPAAPFCRFSAVERRLPGTLEFVGTETIDDVVVALTTHVAPVDVTVTMRAREGKQNPSL